MIILFIFDNKHHFCSVNDNESNEIARDVSFLLHTYKIHFSFRVSGVVIQNKTIHDERKIRKREWRKVSKVEAFLKTYAFEKGLQDEYVATRLQELAQFERANTHKWSTDEVLFGAKLAWRNSNKCIGRLFWNSLHGIDRRDLRDEEAVYQALLEHIRVATNGGKIKPTITIFSNDVRIWNHQLIRYAGYEVDGKIIGDSASIEFTKQCIALGWEPSYGPFDILPLAIQVDGRLPKLFDIPDSVILEVPLHHPDYEWFEELQLKWYAVPMISDMAMEIGDTTFRAAPFNGWYMGTEIGARNLADEHRYNCLPMIAEKMGLNVKQKSTLWQDAALVTLNQAVLYSYKKAGVSIVDHHTAVEQFELFEKKEHQAGRDVTGNWMWLVPPMAPATTSIYYRPFNNEKKSPNYAYQPKPMLLLPSLP